MTIDLSQKGSLKRFYIPGVVYFVTAVTKNRVPYFQEKILRNVFLAELNLCSKLKEFELYGYTVQKDHVHLLIKVGEKYNISQIMHFLKRNLSRNINRIMDSKMSEVPAFNVAKDDHPWLQDGAAGNRRDTKNKNDHPPLREEIADIEEKIKNLQKQFHQKYPQNPFSKFFWQPSFYDHGIRNEKDFLKHWEYIQYNCLKHKSHVQKII